MTTEKIEKLRSFLLDNIDAMEVDSAGGFFPESPDFDLYARDYLNFAEQELALHQEATSDQARIRHLTNCVTNLKRAMDCQLDTFLYAYNLFQIFHKRNLKFEKKLEFLKACGIFSSRSLVRLNTLRNSMEHSYEVPEIEDIEVYYDLVAAFVAVLQRAISSTTGSEMYIATGVKEGDIFHHSRDGHLEFEYQKEKPEIRIIWHKYALESQKEVKEEMTATMDNPEEFAFFFKVILLMQDLDHYASYGYIYQQLSS